MKLVPSEDPGKPRAIKVALEVTGPGAGVLAGGNVEAQGSR